jgi:hypothetical protein
MAALRRLRKRGDHPDFLDLPWDLPLVAWGSPPVVRMAHGRARHVVRFVAYDERAYALKETDLASAQREYDALLALAEEQLPVVDPVGVAEIDRGSEGTGAVLITRYLDFSLPYQYLYGREGGPALDRRLVDAAVVLLARLHLEGAYWGDCSLSNVLFRRDAGGLAAYLVDAETVEIQPSLADGMRLHDLEIATENFAAGLADLVAAGRATADPVEAAEHLQLRYRQLWAELTEAEEIPTDARHLIEHRVRRLHELGFDVEELAIEAPGDEPTRLRIRPTVVEEGHHNRTLRRWTGLDVQENQARRLLDDIASFGARLAVEAATEVPQAVVASRWLTEVYHPTLDRVPRELRDRLEGPELFHEVLEHRYYRSLEQATDVGMGDAVASYVSTILSGRPDERRLPATADPDEG